MEIPFSAADDEDETKNENLSVLFSIILFHHHDHPFSLFSVYRPSTLLTASSSRNVMVVRARAKKMLLVGNPFVGSCYLDQPEPIFVTMDNILDKNL